MEEFLSHIDTEAIAQWGKDVGIYNLTNANWGWPIFEISHYIGLSLLFGTIGLYDLRVMGLAKGIPVKALHRFIPLGVFGFLVNLATGFMFFVTQPYLYVYNLGGQIKVVALLLAGLNMVVFYAFLAHRTNAVGAGEDAPFPAKMAAFVSFFAWVTVLCAGRFLGFLKP